jgi:pilus assembly protein CpaE
MKSQDEVIILTADRSVAALVARALEHDNHLAVTGHYDDLSEVVAQLSQRPASAVVVDVDPDPPTAIEQLAPVATRFAKTCFIVLSEQWDEAIVLEAMEAGVRHFMRKESVREELSGVLRRVLPRLSPEEGTNGAIITVLSAAGGCGATTVAVNLANELRLSQGAEASVLLVDMDTAYGSVATFLNLSGTYGLADVVNQAGPVDVELVRSSATTWSDGGLDVLLSPATVNPKSPPAINDGEMGRAVATFKQAYDYTVIDAPRVRPDVAATLAEASRATLVVMQSNVKDIRFGKHICSMLTEKGAPAARIIPTVSRFSRKTSSVGLAELKRAIGVDDIAMICNDFPHAIQSIDMGEPLAVTGARSALRRDIQKLAEAFVSAAR